ncbi:hypothetical protein [Serratia sp. (in: enterobacteria)]|uniref:hypothetical protein n=1 Tax=Serratia sp. (in: enterobacteria) TaxID=616 RepID=UPI0039898771
MSERNQKYYKEGDAKHYSKHKIYCQFCSHYEIEVAHWDGTSFSIDVICSKCGTTTNYRHDNPYDTNGVKKEKKK